jgi:hypothetical protein
MESFTARKCAFTRRLAAKNALFFTPRYGPPRSNAWAGSRQQG